MKEQIEPLHLFEGYGIELEYMIVDRKTLRVMPISDKIIEKASGSITGEILYHGLGWSNELVMHVLEMKTPGPAGSLNSLSDLFHQGIFNANHILEEFGGMLMPTAMHPFFDPERETRLWLHDNKEIYEAYDRIFDCRGHGWSNLQSVHINLPFNGDEEFGKLHAAIRLVLPLLPALASSSPLVEGKFTGIWDNRLEYYRKNQLRLPVISGKIIPEQAYSKQEYCERIYRPIEQAIKPFDPHEILDPVWLNSRGAIARFDRNAIEIRLLDIQECPKSDLAIVAFLSDLIRLLIDQEWADYHTQKEFAEEPLFQILLQSMKSGESAIIDNPYYLKLFHFPKAGKVSMKELLLHLFETMKNHQKTLSLFEKELDFILNRGTLSSRIIQALPKNPDQQDLLSLYQILCQCLAENKLFHV